MGSATLPIDAAAAARDWRPMAFGLKPARTVDNPIAEPAWGGPRVLVFVAGRVVEIRDETGAAITPQPALEDALIEAAATSGSAAVLLDGHLTATPTRGTVGVGIGLDIDAMNPAAMGRQFILGDSGRRNQRRDRLEADQARREAIPDDGPIACVAIDLLWIDDEPLVAVPLLERKRLLEAALTESDLVRLSVHVRPPLEAWYGQWRAFGFREMAIRDANGRYRPGEQADDWAMALIPRR